MSDVVVLTEDEVIVVVADGGQGMPGPPGPGIPGTFPSADPGNSVSLGSDNGLYAPLPQTLASAQW